MKIDYLDTEHWNTINDEVKRHLGFEGPEALRLYPGLGSAIYDICSGTSHFFAHKKQIAIVKGTTPFFQPLVSLYLKEMYQIQYGQFQQLYSDSASDKKSTEIPSTASSSNIASAPIASAEVAESVLSAVRPEEAWVKALHKDTVFVLFTEDHAVTAEKYNWDLLDQLLNDRKIFAIRVSHHNHFFNRTSVRPYSVRICSVNGKVVYSVHGDRFKSPPKFAHTIPILAQEIFETFKELESEEREDIESIKRFEAIAAEFSQVYFANSRTNQSPATRLWDRSVLIFEDLSADLIIAQILNRNWDWNRDLNLNLKHHIATTNLCHLGVINRHIFHGWWEPAPTSEALRGLLILSLDLIEQAGFADSLRSIVEELRAKNLTACSS